MFPSGTCLPHHLMHCGVLLVSIFKKWCTSEPSIQVQCLWTCRQYYFSSLGSLCLYLTHKKKKNCAGTSEKEVQTPLASLYKFCQMLAGFDGKWSWMVVKCTCIAVHFFAVRGCNSHVVHFESKFLETEQQMVMVSILANLNYDSFIFMLTSKN